MTENIRMSNHPAGAGYTVFSGSTAFQNFAHNTIEP